MIFNKDKPFSISFLLPLFYASQLLAQNVIQPNVYHSNNQMYALLVSPLSPDGLDGAKYSLQKLGQTIWQKQLQATAMMADVSDAGDTITCAHSRGLEPPFDRNNRDDLGYMQLSLIDATGHLIWSQSVKRQHSMAFHEPPTPYCEQVLIQSHTKQAFFWYDQDQHTQLKVIDINTGKSVQGINLSLQQARDLTSVEDITFHDMGASDLLLVEISGWVYEDNETGNGSYGYLSDALYYLLDTKGQVYWQQHLMGSLDIRKTHSEEEQQPAYQQRDAYLKAHDLIRLNHEKKQFAITYYNDQQLHWYQINNHQVKRIKTESLVNISTPFEVKVNNLSSPKLLGNIDLLNHKTEEKLACNQVYTAIDVTADGVLLLYNEDNHSISRVDGSVVSTFITIPSDWIKDDYISHEKMFVGQHDYIYVNIGEANYAVYDTDGQYLETQVWQKGCGEFCFTDFVLQKSTGKLWSENGKHQVMLAHFAEEGYVPEVVVEKDANGRWFEYIYAMQSDPQGRLMMLGRTENAFNHLYVWDTIGDPVTTLDLGYGYVSAATLGNDLAFISKANSDEIALLSFTGGVIQRFKTDNQQPPYLLRVYKDKLYAVTNDAVLVYDVSTFNKY